MAITQLSVFLENRLGRLNEVISVLGKNNVNIRALSLADTAEYGILRLIVNDTDRALKVLKEENFLVSKTDVIAVEVEDSPGGLARILNLLFEQKLNVEYMYAFVEKSQNKAVVVFRLEESEKTEKILEEKNIKILNEEEIRSL